MTLLTTIFIAVGLSMDAVAISITGGAAAKSTNVPYAFRIGFFFGGFQALMPVIGWLAGLSLKNFISGIDHWIAFGLLCFIGVKMLLESGKLKEDRQTLLNGYVLFILAIATSMDALAVGLTLSFLGVTIFAPALVIGVVTFTLSFLGVLIGSKVKHLFANKIEIAGGLILIIIGTKILIEHLRL